MVGQPSIDAGIFRLGDGTAEIAVLTGAEVRSFEHVEGSAIVLDLKIEDHQQVRHANELVIMPDLAEHLARALFAALVRMRHDFGEEPAHSSARLLDGKAPG